VPPPEISIDIPVDTGRALPSANVTSERPVAAPPPIAAPKPVERQVVKTRVHAGPWRAHHPARVPPAVASRRRGGHGVQLQVFVLDSGRAVR